MCDVSNKRFNDRLPIDGIRLKNQIKKEKKN